MARPRPPRPGTSTLATPSRGTAVAIGRAARGPRTAAVALSDWRADSVVVRITAKVHDLVTEAGGRNAETVVAVGKHLRSIRDRLLPQGTWLQWIEDNASFGRSTAANYIDLAAWSEKETAQYERLKHLGPGKLYVLVAVRPERVRALKTGKAVPLPGSGRRKTIEAMTTLELASVVGGLKTPDAQVVPIDRVVQTVRFKVAALGAAADVLVERADEVDEDVVRGIQAEVSEVLARLEGILP